ncbi:hypothetical protein, partial [Streptomyces wedmorensis]
RRILPVISRRGAPNIKGMGKLRYVVEQGEGLFHDVAAVTASSCNKENAPSPPTTEQSRSSYSPAGRDP